MIFGSGLVLNVTTPNHGEDNAPDTISFPCPVRMKAGFAVGWPKEGEVLVARFGYRLKSGHWEVDAAIHRPGAILQRASVLPLNAFRHWGLRDDDGLDNAWLCMCNHAGRGTRAGAEGREEEGAGDDDTSSLSSAGDQRSCSADKPSPGSPSWPRKVPRPASSLGVEEP